MPPLALYQLPLWCIREAWAQLTLQQRQTAAGRSTFHGDFAAVQFLWEAGGRALSARWCCAAAAGGQLEMLQYLRGEGCPWDIYTCIASARCGNLEVLRYAHEGGCPWPIRICDAAAGAGHVHILGYLHQTAALGTDTRAMPLPGPAIRQPCSPRTSTGAPGEPKHAKRQRWGVTWLCCSTCTRMAAAPGIKQGTCYAAAGGNHSEMLRFAVERGCPLSIPLCRHFCRAARPCCRGSQLVVDFS